MDLATLTVLSERIAADYAASHGMRRYCTWHLLRLQDDADELTKAWLDLAGHPEPEHHAGRAELVAADLTDVLVQTLVLARQLGVDLAAEVERLAAEPAAAPVAVEEY